MSGTDSDLLKRADEAIAESKRLQHHSESLVAESRYWSQHLYWSLGSEKGRNLFEPASRDSLSM